MSVHRKPVGYEVEREADLKQTRQWRMCTKLKSYLVGASQDKMVLYSQPILLLLH